MGQPISDGPIDIALVGDLTDNEAELTDKLLSVPPGGHCTLWIDSPGGSPYCAMSLMSLMLLRGIQSHRHRHGRMFVGRAMAVCRLPSPASDAVQRALVSPDEVAERRTCPPGRGGRMGATLWTLGNRHGSAPGPDVRRLRSRDGQVDQPGPTSAGRSWWPSGWPRWSAQDAGPVRHERRRARASASPARAADEGLRPEA